MVPEDSEEWGLNEMARQAIESLMEGNAAPAPNWRLDFTCLEENFLSRVAMSGYSVDMRTSGLTRVPSTCAQSKRAAV